ncbi:M20 aminoacylase family protein [Limoniibacter endophyticus]|uniref:Amidohydrolase n=1 Tax=Limoniibacter endophyticus TaxID=1565040 RepID=A0A8J3DSB9_9HYPH|nr:M20 aminoacylase family protein [Limoniibacter endophyticus]GHC71964.1 amidohydrolase [Limoniibacter endophyticus]
MASAYISSDEIEEAIKWRHHLHEHPELAFEEDQTSQFIAGQLSNWGYEVKRGYGKTGVVASLHRGSSEKSLAIRADMDALPILEESGVAYASKAPGKMHACGHDGHVATALAAARACTRASFDGTVHFVFQPAEENEGGGRAMVEGGLFRDFNIDAIYGMHNWPALDVGQGVARDDQMMAAFGTFEIMIEGRGAHGAMPHEGADPIVAASHIAAGLQTIASRNVSPLQAAVVSVTQIHAGETWNVIPGHAMIRGTTRWFDAEVGDKLEERLTALAQAIATGFGCSAKVGYTRRYPATINDPRCARIVRDVAAATDILQFVDAAPSMAAEDFAFMLEEKPGCYFWLGAKKEGRNPGLHSPFFDFNDKVLPLGANLWVALVESQLSV